MRRVPARRRLAVSAAALLCAVALIVLLAPASRPRAVPTAGAFFNSVGVDTHLTFDNTSYSQWPRLVALLRVLGVRHLADGAYANPAPNWTGFNQLFDGRVRLAAANGLKFAFEMGKPGYTGGSIPELVAVMAGPLRNAMEAILDPNEFDTTSGLSDWSDPLNAYDRALHTAVKANPSLHSLPVIGPSLVGDSAAARLGSQQAWLTAGAIHPYTGGSSPTAAYTQQQLARISAVSGRKPVWATETGYSNALNAASSEQPVSELVGAVYLLREFLGNFAAGIPRTYVYELIDDVPDPGLTNIQAHYGLLRADYTPKPAYLALRNLLALIGDHSPATTAPLRFSVTHKPSDLRTLTLQQSAHAYLVILWRESSIWNVTTRQPITVPAQSASLVIPAAHAAALADPLLTATPSPVAVARGGGLQIPVGADPIVVRVTVGGPS